MPYIECPGCGQKVLDIATRCPHCGRPAEARPSRYPRARSRVQVTPRGLFLVVLLVGVAALVVDAARRESRVAPLRAPAAVSVESTAPPRSVSSGESLEARPYTAAEGLPPVAVVDSPPPPSRNTAQPVAPVVPLAAVASPVPVEPSGAEQRQVNTWVNLRAERSRTAPVIRVLRPGDVVLADSLRRGWYRVAADGGTYGYLDARFLEPQNAPR